MIARVEKISTSSHGLASREHEEALTCLAHGINLRYVGNHERDLGASPCCTGLKWFRGVGTNDRKRGTSRKDILTTATSVYTISVIGVICIIS
jgi:hypothetical protein